MKEALGRTICILFIIAIVKPSSATWDAVVVEEDAVVIRPQPLQVGYKTVSYTIGNDASGRSRYSNFLTNLRAEFKDPRTERACDLPVTRATLPPNAEYVLVELKISETQKVTLALQVSNLYLVAFRFNNYNAKFFKEEKGQTIIANAKKKVFTDGKQEDLKYTVNYKDIEGKGGSRENLGLGLGELENRIKAFYKDNKPVTESEEAKFVLVALQMVCEAARYKYIENKVVTSKSHFKPDGKIIDLQISWQRNSKKVRQAQANKNCGSVKDITMDMALLLGTGTAPTPPPPPPRAFRDYLWSKIAVNPPNIPLINDAVF